MNNPVILSLVAGFFFGTWPLIARYVAVKSFWIAVLIPVGTFLLVIAASAGKLTQIEIPPMRALGIGLVAGAFNGAGMILYGKVLANPDLDVSKFVPVAAVSSLSFAAVGGLLLFKESLTLQKAAGLVFAAVAVWLLR